jgi:hypothetical protein
VPAEVRVWDPRGRWPLGVGRVFVAIPIIFISIFLRNSLRNVK